MRRYQTSKAIFIIMKPNHCKIVRYSGQVQGVGFRYTACRVAKNYDISGYAKNLPDGTVECLIEGDSKQIAGFLGDLANQMSGYIRKAQIQSAPPSGRYYDFGIEF